MTQLYRLVLAVFVAALLLPLTSVTSSAGSCQRLAATAIAVGKGQSTADAKEELADYVGSYMNSRGIKNARMGKISVSCKDYIQLLNEYKCRAVRTFCW